MLERVLQEVGIRPQAARPSAPYFHDGRVATLEEAVRLMGWHQLDLRLAPDDIADFIAFLETLEGNPPPVGEPR